MSLQDGDEPIYMRLYRSIRDHVATGRWPVGTRVPSTRLMAADLGIARGTAALAIDQLISEGWLVSEARSGVFVPDLARRPAPDEEVDAANGRPPVSRRSFRELTSPTRLFPIARWRQLQTQVWSNADPLELLMAENAGGHPRLRDAIARLACGSRGVMASPDQVIVCSSGHAAVETAIRVAVPEGGRVIVETPGDAALAERLRRAGFKVSAVHVDLDGLRTPDLPPSAEAVIVSTAMHLPLGCSLASERRRELLAWAAQSGAIIVELDCEGHLALSDGKPIQPLAARGTERGIVYVRDFDRVTFPGLSLAFAVMPSGYEERARRVRQGVDRALPMSDQLVLADFIASGGLAGHLRSLRPTMRSARETIARDLDGLVGGDILHVRVAGNIVHLVTDRSCEQSLADEIRHSGAAAWSLSELSTDGQTVVSGVVLAAINIDSAIVTAALRRETVGQLQPAH